jgi:hypothetical protein
MSKMLLSCSRGLGLEFRSYSELFSELFSVSSSVCLKQVHVQIQFGTCCCQVFRTFGMIEAWENLFLFLIAIRFCRSCRRKHDWTVACSTFFGCLLACHRSHHQ